MRGHGIDRLTLSLGLLTVGCASPAPPTDAGRSARVAEMAEALEARFATVETVSVEEVGRLLEKDSVVLVDVREPRERAVSIIPGAISAETFERDPARYDGLAVVAYCTIGHRSSEYASRLNSDGWRVRNLRGSILAWVHAGGPLVADGRPTRRLHVYGREWDLAPAAYETVF